MIKLYCHESLIVIHNLKNLLEHQGIKCQLKNELINASSGEVPPIEGWPEIWIKQPEDYDQAMVLIDEAMNGSPSKVSWSCPHCGEVNGPAFELCWKCGQEAL